MKLGRRLVMLPLALSPAWKRRRKFLLMGATFGRFWAMRNLQLCGIAGGFKPFRAKLIARVPD